MSVRMRARAPGCAAKLPGGIGEVSPRILLVNQPVVVIADDHELIRERLRRLLSPKCRIAGAAADGDELIAVCRDQRPEVVISDILMPGVSGLDALRLLRVELPEIKVIFVSELLDPSVIEEAIRGGAAGFVAKRHAAEDLPVALDEVLRGGSFISPACIRSHDAASPK